MLLNLKKIFFNHGVYLKIDSENILDKQRFVLFSIFSLTGAAASSGVFVKMYFMFESLKPVHFLLPALSLIMLINFYIIKTPSRLTKAYFVILMSAFILLHIVSYSTGGIRSASILYYAVLILYAFMLIGRKTGQFFTALLCTQVIYIFFVTRYTGLTSFDFLQNKTSHIEEDFLFNGLFAFFLIAAQSVYLNSGRNIVLRKIIRQRDELAYKNLLLQQSNITLDNQNKELDKFAYIVSHDLKAPLRAIGNLAGWVDEDNRGKLNAETCEHLKTITSRVVRMEALINGILQYSKTSRQKEVVKDINIKILLNETIDLLNANNFCVLRIPETLPSIKMCTVKLQQVFLNLLDNAIRHNDKPNIRIEINLRYEENNFYFSFKDNGPGIEPEYHERIFIIFQTLKARDQFESTGVGLAIVKKIIDDEGGEITVESEAGGGVSFNFILPDKKNVFTRIQQKDFLVPA